jgi:uncharacterized BrkB/YihY/UPF0761 family membrane protein
VPETTLCRLCGTQNAPNASMCAWCETSLTDPFRGARTRPADARRMMVDSRRSSDSIPYGADSSIDRWLFAIGNILVISALIGILIACPIAVTLLLHKQQAVDNAAAYYRGPQSHPTSEFPGYGALSIIPSLTFALTVYLLFRWVTRKRRDNDW